MKICVANPPHSAKVSGVYKAIENGLEDTSCYRLDPDLTTAAAIEFVAVLTSTAAIATIANFLYKVWKDHRDKGQLYVYVNPDVQIMITDKTVMLEIEEFQRKVNQAHTTGQQTQMDQEILDEIKHRRIWIKTK